MKEAGFTAMGWAWNARAKSERLNWVLGWKKPDASSIEREIPEMLKTEHERLKGRAGV